jgi:3'-phosphoadenosine 5'-phosphosulfate (PAPS) 3'-phosphatase
MPAAVDPALVDEAVLLARMAGELTLRYFRADDLGVDEKVDGTPVTVADRAAERLVREELARRHPDDGVLGEEEPNRPAHRAAVGSSIRSTAPRPSPGACRCTRTCWRSRTPRASPWAS